MELLYTYTIKRFLRREKTISVFVDWDNRSYEVKIN